MVFGRSRNTEGKCKCGGARVAARGTIKLQFPECAAFLSFGLQDGGAGQNWCVSEKCMGKGACDCGILRHWYFRYDTTLDQPLHKIQWHGQPSCTICVSSSSSR